ncbi:carbonic anhydrase/acetyltransferase-like protein (isoleucine patch superfamily) [Desulfobotulus alkaliphilus]|uniref:Carbonic anhydrase/acetyltransferase-like protein (Isoleucine patch superfamily) n=1 Tax=Desulfobotulus alkaliphilus TaxID=622671 RepID=A0A562RNT2_9BACT|nr:gamma carbonic anhydrase family protein [Desulfobotulus alkaliphilus]TWI70735.1 carbonic anhydrase/acetyltransferase-like protein (isoleucine patch superfamily) [Desulfobotulus alkaliphilus]
MAIHRFENETPFLAETVFIAPGATVIGDVHMAAGSSLWFSAVIRGDTAPIRIDENTNIQDLCMLHADPGFPLTLGKNITAGHRAILHGCTVEDDCLIGMGAVVMNSAVIGRGSIVAAGAVVLENTVVPPFSLIAGMPAKVVKTFKEDIIEVIRESAKHYCEKAASYRNPEKFE